MHSHPLIHGDLVAQQQIDLRRELARPRSPARLRRTKPTGSAFDSELVSIVRAAQVGETAAWEALVNRFTPMLKATARSYRLCAADVEDVVQTTWAAAFANIARIREPEAIAGWLRVTAGREALRTIRRRQREIPVHEVRGSDPDEPTAERLLLLEERHEALHAALERLPIRQRSIVAALLSNKEPSQNDLARRLTIPPGSIGPTRIRAITRLRRDKRLASLAD
jgi:RNA polymerase sigma factor (sigma-70 family)